MSHSILITYEIPKKKKRKKKIERRWACRECVSEIERVRERETNRRNNLKIKKKKSCHSIKSYVLLVWKHERRMNNNNNKESKKKNYGK